MKQQKRPIIGITTDYNSRQTAYESPYGYSLAVEKAGGLPLLIPYRSDFSLIPQIVDVLHGIIFSGGDDLDPAAYGETYHPQACPIDPARERFERAILAEVERRRLPTLGICLGSQLMNVHRGGSLIQFLPDVLNGNGALEHRRLDDWTRRHDATLIPETTIANALGRRDVVINTSHKQAVKKLGRGLRVIATSPDGVIEGTEDPTMPLFLGVQWHPERMSDEPAQLALFELLVQKARENSR